MLPLLVALVVFALAGLGFTALVRRRPAETGDLKPGLAHLAGLRWREFARLVLQAMEARGYEVVRDSDSPADGLPGDGGDILLTRGSQRTLLSCKYGNASVVGAQSILGLGKSAELRGAHSAIVVSPGRFDDEARRVASQQHVELIDGATLWPEVKPFIAQPIENAQAKTVPRAHLAFAWAGAAVAGGVAWMFVQGLQPQAEAEPVPAPVAAAAPAATPASPGAPRPASQSPAPSPAPSEAVPTDAATLDRRRVEVANAISTLAGIDRAIWSTQSTLLVYLAGDADPSASMCPLLERYPELAASRVQLQPPPGSDRPVRFKQCKAY
jgi:hypothetical protein